MLMLTPFFFFSEGSVSYRVKKMTRGIYLFFTHDKKTRVDSAIQEKNITTFTGGEEKTSVFYLPQLFKNSHHIRQDIIIHDLSIHPLISLLFF